jgi:hypothetical protein
MPNTTYGTAYAQSSDLVSNWPGVSLNVADRIDDVSFKGNGLNDQTGTTYTLVLTDAGKTLTLNNASAVTVTVPANASVAYENGTTICIVNKGAGAVTLTAAAGVTINSNATVSQNRAAWLCKLDTNTWVLIPGGTVVQFTTATASVATSQTTTSTSYTDLATTGPSVTLATGTKALVIVSGKLNNASLGNAASMSMAVSGATSLGASDAYRIYTSASVGSSYPAEIYASKVTLLTGLTAGSNTFTAKYKANASTASFADREITVIDMGS